MNRREFDQQPDSEKHSEDRQPPGKAMVIPVIEEQLQVETRIVETGTVRINKKVHEEEVNVDAPVVYDNLDIERIPINEYVDTAPPAVRYEGDTMIVPILEEVVVVEKRLVLREELRITKRQVHTNVSKPVTLRKEEVTIERIDHRDDDQNPVHTP